MDLLRELQSIEKNVIEILVIISSTFYTVYPACDVTEIDLVIEQDGR